MLTMLKRRNCKLLEGAALASSQTLPERMFANSTASVNTEFPYQASFIFFVVFERYLRFIFLVV